MSFFSFFPLSFEEKAWRYFSVNSTYFPHMGSFIWTNRKKYKEKEQERQLKSRNEKVLRRNYGDLKPLLLPRLFPVVFRGRLEHNEDSPSVHPALYLSLPFYIVAAIKLECVCMYVHFVCAGSCVCVCLQPTVCFLCLYACHAYMNLCFISPSPHYFSSFQPTSLKSHRQSTETADFSRAREGRNRQINDPTSLLR